MASPEGALENFYLQGVRKADGTYNTGAQNILLRTLSAWGLGVTVSPGFHPGLCSPALSGHSASGSGPLMTILYGKSLKYFKRLYTRIVMSKPGPKSHVRLRLV